MGGKGVNIGKRLEREDLISDVLIISKDNNYSYLNVDKNEIFSLTENLTANEYGEEYVETSPIISMDGKKIFYKDEGFSNLYYKDLKEKDMEKATKKIDTSVRDFLVDETGKWIVYIKSDINGLYINNLEEKNKISNDVSGFYMNNDINKILYVKKDGEIHFLSDRENDEIIDKNSEIQYVAEDFSFVIYLKDKTLFKYNIGGEKDKIAQNVDSVEQVFKDGTCFYTVCESEEIYYEDHILDDLQERDEEIINMFEKAVLEYTEEGEVYDFEYFLQKSNGDYYVAYNNYYNYIYEYNSDWYDGTSPLLNEVLLRIKIKMSLSTETIFGLGVNLFYYNGNDSEKVTNNYESGTFLDGDAYTYSMFDLKDTKKINISEIYKLICEKINGIDEATDINELDVEEIYNIDEQSYIENLDIEEILEDVEDMITIETSEHIYLNGIKLDTEFAIYDFQMADDGKTYYYLMSDGGEDSNNELYKIKVEDTKENQKPEKVYDDVAKFGFYGKSKKLYTFRDNGDYSSIADLYCEDKIVCYDASIYSFGEKNFVPETDEFYILADVNENTETGILYKWNGDKTMSIYDDAYDNICVCKDNAFFIGDYSVNSGFGSVYKVKGDKAEIVDQDNVDYIFTGISSVESNFIAMNELYYIEEEDEYSDYWDYE